MVEAAAVLNTCTEKIASEASTWAAVALLLVAPSWVACSQDTASSGAPAASLKLGKDTSGSIPQFCLTPQFLVPPEHIEHFSPEQTQVLHAAFRLLDLTLATDDPRRQIAASIPFVPMEQSHPAYSYSMAAYSAVWGDLTDQVTGATETRFLGAQIAVKTEANFGSFFRFAAVLGHELQHAARHQDLAQNQGETFRRETEATGAECNDILEFRAMIEGGSAVSLSERQQHGVRWAHELDVALDSSKLLHYHYYVQFDLWQLRTDLNNMARFARSKGELELEATLTRIADSTGPFLAQLPNQSLDAKAIRTVFESVESLLSSNGLLRDHPNTTSYGITIVERKARLQMLADAQ